MSLPEPKFETRTYRDLFNEAIARIPAHTPEWTNRSEPDPGVTLLQLFAFMSESLLYRTNLIPERNRQKFLRLLQIPMRPAAAASGLVSFSNPRGSFDVITLNRNQSLAAGNVSFKTDSGLAVLPIEARIYYKKPVSTADSAGLTDLYNNLYAAFDLPQNKLAFYETSVFEPATTGTNLKTIDIAKETVDGAIWLALLSRSSESPDEARDKIANTVLSLGIFPSVGEDGSVLQPVQPLAQTQQDLVFEVPNAADDRIRYEPLAYTAEHDLLKQPGIVKLNLPAADKLTLWPEQALTAGVDNRPPSLDSSDDQARLITWLRVRAPQVNTSADIASRQLSIKLAWCGINAADIEQRTDVAGEKLTDGTGKPDQVVRLLNRPVIDGTLQLYVNGELWQPIDDLAAAPSELDHQSGNTQSTSSSGAASNRVYQLDKEAGEIRFGNGVFGARPPQGALIQASYSHGGGLQGMVGIGTIQKAPALPPGVKVSNPVPTWGGTAAEKVADAERNIPQAIRHGERLISEQDYRDIVVRAPGVDIGRVDILPLFHPKLPKQTSAGVVTVLVIPTIDAVHPDSPEPDQFMLDKVCNYLSPRRVLTSELHIRGPIYQEVWISVGLSVVPGFDPSPVREAVKNEIQTFLSPLVGGFSGTGWPLQKTMDGLEISAAVTRVDGVSKVNQLLLAESTGPDVAVIAMEGLDLPRVMKISVVEGDALSIDDIRGDTEAASNIGAGGANVVPVPVVPAEC